MTLIAYIFPALLSYRWCIYGVNFKWMSELHRKKIDIQLSTNFQSCKKAQLQIILTKAEVFSIFLVLIEKFYCVFVTQGGACVFL